VCCDVENDARGTGIAHVKDAVLDGNETLEHICVGVAPLDLRLFETHVGPLGFYDGRDCIKSGIPNEQMLGFEIRD
jgi:hypothetical protein